MSRKRRPRPAVQTTKCYRCASYTSQPIKVRTPEGHTAWWCDACVRFVRPIVEKEQSHD